MHKKEVCSSFFNEQKLRYHLVETINYWGERNETESPNILCSLRKRNILIFLNLFAPVPEGDNIHFCRQTLLFHREEFFWPAGSLERAESEDRKCKERTVIGTEKYSKKQAPTCIQKRSSGTIFSIPSLINEAEAWSLTKDL